MSFYINLGAKLFNQKIPSGAGSLFIVPLILFTIFQSYNIELLLVISFLTIIYFIDDIKKLSFIVRIIIQLISGLIIVLSSNFNNLPEIEYLFFLMGVLFIFFNTNIFNFNDGANLHISTILVQIFAYFLLFADPISEIFNIFFIICLIFITIFSYFNYKNLLYFGDSGCYLFSCFILIFLNENYSIFNFFLFLLITSFYTIDVVYVFFLRIIKKENLLTRNFHHFYQKLDNKYNNYIFLIPGIVLNIIVVNLFILGPSIYLFVALYFLVFICYMLLRFKLFRI